VAAAGRCGEGCIAGYEAALAAALGDDIEAPANEASPVHWRGLPPLDRKPAAASKPNRWAGMSRPPPHWPARLSQTGVVTRAQGAALQPDLRPGQRLVSREGDLWRWDGYVAAADAPTAAATRLAERNRLGGLEEAEAAARAAAETAKQAFEAARHEADAATARDRAAREALRAAAAALETARGRLAAHERATRSGRARPTCLARRRAGWPNSSARRATWPPTTESELGGLADPADLGARGGTLRADLDTCRGPITRPGRATTPGRGGAHARRPAHAIGRERTQWRDRAAKASSQVDVLEARAAEARTQLARWPICRPSSRPGAASS
jgi:chromosome segregation protein